MHVPSLDGIRVGAFLMVFAAHAGLEGIVPGGFGVTVFFFLSGYLITTLLRVERERSGTVSLSQFYLRRVLRILPPFYVVLGAAALAALFGFLPGTLSGRALAAQALHVANYWTVIHGYDGQPAGTGVYWSLAVEEHFYLVFPCVFLLLGRFVRAPGRAAVVLWSLCALVLAWRCVLVFGFHASDLRTYLASDTRVDSILFGCALALRGNPMLDGPSRFSERTFKWVLVPLALGLLVITFSVRGSAFRETFRYTLQGLALGPLFIAAIRFPHWALLKPLNGPVAKLAGGLSYSLYLVHQVVLDAVGETPSWWRAVVAMIVSIALAWAIQKLVENPAASLRRYLAARRSRVAAPALGPAVT
jgi:peptidoglycan/LPS O-acetylase OafA/YrhL